MLERKRPGCAGWFFEEQDIGVRSNQAQVMQHTLLHVLSLSCTKVLSELDDILA
jgi:hypothetical protein